MEEVKYTNLLTEEEVIQILIKNIGKTGFCLNKFIIKSASSSPSGFLGEHYRVKADVSIEGTIHHFYYFLKKIPTEIPQHLEYAVKTRAFYKEIELYSTLFVDLKNAQSNSSTATKWCPEFFYSRQTDFLVLEDLSELGYFMYPERQLMDKNYIKVSLKAMAAMHSASVIFEEKFNKGNLKTLSPTFTSRSESERKITIGEVYSHLVFETEASDEKNHPGNTYHEAGILSVLKIVNLLPGYSAEEKKKIKEKLPDVLRYSLQLVKPSTRFKNVFIHGDLWSNNILFHKDQAGNVKDAILIDFQLARYAPPAHDVMMFLHLVQDEKFFKENKEELLLYYYEAFCEAFKKNNLKAEQFLPYKIFLESCRFYEDLGLICKLFYFQLILAPSNIISKYLSVPELFVQTMFVDRSEMVVECFLKDEYCKSRIMGAMTEIIKKFILI